MSKDKVILDLKELGKITRCPVECHLGDDLGVVSTKHLNDLTDLNAYAIQSGCSACSSTGLGYCC